MQEIVELAGYTARVGNMLQVFEEVQRGRYVRVSVISDNEQRDSRCPANLIFKNGVPLINGWYYRQRQSANEVLYIVSSKSVHIFYGNKFLLMKLEQFFKTEHYSIWNFKMDGQSLKGYGRVDSPHSFSFVQASSMRV